MKYVTSFLHVAEQLIEKFFSLWIVVNFVKLKENNKNKLTNDPKRKASEIFKSVDRHFCS